MLGIRSFRFSYRMSSCYSYGLFRSYINTSVCIKTFFEDVCRGMFKQLHSLNSLLLFQVKSPRLEKARSAQVDVWRHVTCILFLQAVDHKSPINLLGNVLGKQGCLLMRCCQLSVLCKCLSVSLCLSVSVVLCNYGCHWLLLFA